MANVDKSPPTVTETCKYYVSVQQPECGKPATHKVKVRNRAGQMIVPLCDEHKAKHDETFARARTGSGKVG